MVFINSKDKKYTYLMLQTSNFELSYIVIIAELNYIFQKKSKSY